MFRIYYYIFGLDRKKRYVVCSSVLKDGIIDQKLQITKEKTSFLPCGWRESTINCADFDECIKMDAQEIMEKYKCPTYPEVEYDIPLDDTPETVTIMTQMAKTINSRYERIFRQEYLIRCKNARQ